MTGLGWRRARTGRSLRSRIRVVLGGALATVVVAGVVTAVAPSPAAATAPKPRAQVLDPVPTRPALVGRAPDNVAARLAAQAPTAPVPMWPKAGVAVAELAARGVAPATVSPGGLPVRVGAVVEEVINARSARGTAAPGRVRVQAVDQASIAAAGWSGLMVGLSRADGVAVSAQVSVSIDYRQVAGAYGGGFSRRMRLWALPECGLTTPHVSGCQATELPFDNDLARQELSTQVKLPSDGSVYLVGSGGTSSVGGDYKATSLSPAATWSGGGSTGDFTWSYPLRMPPSLGGPSPTIALAYSSQSIDGQTSSTNNQGGPIGDGFSFNHGFIERSYKSCADDGQTGKGDQCWGSDNATLSLSGHGGELIKYSSSPNLWRPTKDDGTRVERIKDTSKNNGDDDGEYWKVTTADGTQYFFGLNRLSGWTSGKAETTSVSYTTVFGDDSGEPCYNSTFANAHCQQAYRWNLDYVVDTHGNTMSFWYTRVANNYSRSVTATSVSTYIRDAYLTRIDYGTDNRSGTDTEFTGTAPARVIFGVTDRCAQTSGCSTHDAAHWPDVPWDQECTSSTSCSGRYSPTYWTTKRLSTVTTQVATGASTWKDVEKWALAVSWLDPGNGDSTKVMWLNTLTRTGLNGSDPDVSLPAITFGPQAQAMQNRVNSTDGNGAFNRFRIATVANETGGVLGVGYSTKDCVVGSKLPASPETNTYRCFPVKWTPPGKSMITDYFHKYVMTGLSQTDNAGGNAAQYVNYAYPTDGAFWHYDESELTASNKKTWGQWRGYEQVTSTTGSVVPGVPQLSTVIKYFRGKHGDKFSSGTRTQTYSVNGTVYNDENWLAGKERGTVVYNGPGGAVVSDTLTEPWSHGPTASRTVNGVTTAAYVTNTLRTTVKTKLDNGRADRVSVVTNTYSDGSDGAPPGLLIKVDDQGDTSISSDDTCVRTTYARNDTRFIYSLVAEVETDALRCTSTPSQASDVLSIARTWYDGGATYPTTPTEGEVTRTEELSTWDATPANRVYDTTSRKTFDNYGRVIEAYDALDNKTTTAYTPASGAPVTATTVTNPKLWTTTTTMEPAWNLPKSITDANNRVTDLTYDALGRLTAVWLAGWSKSAHPSLASLAFVYTVRSSGGPTAVATSKLNTDATAYSTSYELMDGFLRPRQTQVPSATGTGRVITDTFHDSRGLVTKANAAYYTTGSPGTTLLSTADTAVPAQTRTSFDGAGRTTVSALVSQATEKWRTTTAHGGDRVDVTPPTGGTATSTVTDASGNTVELRQYHGATPTPFTAGSYDATQYGYDHAGRPTSVVDQAGNSWSWEYDQRGRKATAADPDKGPTTNTYDAAGHVVSTTDARHVTLSYVYDELGRKIQTWQGAVGSGTQLAQWTYDTLLRGQLTSSTRWDDGNAYTTAITGYDTSNRPMGTSVTIPSVETGLAGTYTFGTTYNANGSVATKTLPAAGGLAAETLTTTYNSADAAQTLSGLAAYVGSTGYLATGEVSTIIRDGGSIEQYWYRDLATMRLTEHLVYAAATTPDVPIDTYYTHDRAGNITAVKDNTAQYGTGYGPDDNQCFSYDHLRRLTEAWTPANGDCNATRNVSALGGAAPYWQSWTYDTTGNRTSQTQHTSGGNQTTNYTYPLAGQSQPHTLIGTTGAGTGSYGYDETGNTISRPGSTGQQSLTWDAEGRLDTLTEGSTTSSYLYDAGGGRLITRDASGTTLHLLEGMEVRVGSGGGNATGTRTYAHAGQTVATRTSTGGTSWLFTDHHGTAELAIRDSDNAITRRRQTPFGTVRGNTVTWPNNHGYVNGYNDASGLTHLGAREYDATTGRFINVDPVIDTNDPQQMHGFSYANNAPSTMSDPDGLRPICDEAGRTTCSPATTTPAPRPSSTTSNKITSPYPSISRRTCNRYECGMWGRYRDEVDLANKGVGMLNDAGQGLEGVRQYNNRFLDTSRRPAFYDPYGVYNRGSQPGIRGAYRIDSLYRNNSMLVDSASKLKYLSKAGGPLALVGWGVDYTEQISTGHSEAEAATAATVATASGLAGAWAGAQVGMFVGSFAGPAGTVVGGLIGGAVGGLAASEAGKAVVNEVWSWFS